jgi:peptidoglycan-associated lipoprotein
MKTYKLMTCFAVLVGFSAGCSSTSSSMPPRSPTTAAAEPAASPASPTRSEPTPAAPERNTEAITPTGVGVEPSLAQACNVKLPEAFFEFDATKAEAPAPKTLDAIAACLTTGPLRGQSVRLVGHADPRGTDAYNAKLGLSRAESVAKYLEHHGIAADRIIVETHGAEHALDIPQAYPFDRRVDVERAEPASPT